MEIAVHCTVKYQMLLPMSMSNELMLNFTPGRITVRDRQEREFIMANRKKRSRSMTHGVRPPPRLPVALAKFS